jgi:hypothetical protein
MLPQIETEMLDCAPLASGIAHHFQKQNLKPRLIFQQNLRQTPRKGALCVKFNCISLPKAALKGREQPRGLLASAAALLQPLCR